MFAEVYYNAVDIVEEGLTGPSGRLINVWCSQPTGILLTPVHENGARGSHRHR
jgi:hypothetical protein